MGLFDGNKAGKGVPKDEREKHDFFRFFEVYIRHFWQLTGLNAMYCVILFPFFCYALLFCAQSFGVELSAYAENRTFQILTLFTNGLPWYFSEILIGASALLIGPATAAANYIWRNLNTNQHIWLFADFFGKIKENFVQGVLTFALQVLVGMSLIMYFTMDYSVYGSMAVAMSLFRYVMIVVFLVVQVIALYAYQLMVTFDLPYKTILKNAWILTILGIFRNVIVLILVGLVALLTSLLLLPLMLVLTFSLTGMLQSFITYPLIEMLLLKPVREQAAQEGKIQIEEPADAVFQDDATGREGK